MGCVFIQIENEQKRITPLFDKSSSFYWNFSMDLFYIGKDGRVFQKLYESTHNRLYSLFLIQDYNSCIFL